MGEAENRALEEGSVFSFSHLRDIGDRLISGFFYGGRHSPEGAQKKTVVRH